MCPVYQGSNNSCGACAAIHVVEHIWGPTFAPKQSDVISVWNKVQLDSAQGAKLVSQSLGDGSESDPFKISKWLKENHALQCTLFVKSGSLVESLLYLLWGNSPPGKTKTGDGIDVNNMGKSKCAIGIYKGAQGLHYLALHMKQNKYYFIDSNNPNATWKVAADPKKIVGMDTYTYVGGSINVV